MTKKLKKHTNFNFDPVYVEALELEIMDRLRHELPINNTSLAILQMDWPDAETTINKLAGLLNHFITHEGKPVLYLIVEEALDKYSDNFKVCLTKRYADPARLGFFVESILDSMMKLNGLKLVGEGGYEWNIFSGQMPAEVLNSDAFENLKAEMEKTKQKQKQTDLEARKALYAMLTHERVRKVLKGVDYEESVVRGAMSAAN